VKIEIVAKKINILGEGPTWDEKNRRLYWVDITGKRFYYLDPDNERVNVFSALGMISSIVTTNKENILAATEDHSLYLIDKKTGMHSLITTVESGRMNTRFNDGKVDPFGRYVAGTMDMKEKNPIGSLYVFSGKDTKKILGNLTVSNGMAWDVKNQVFYHIDSPTKKVNKYYYDKNMNIKHIGTAIDFEREMGVPDGMSIDSTGNLLVAHWGGGKISIWDTNKGRKIEQISFPAENITSCTFGGDGLTDLYVTSAANKDSSDLGGTLFRVRTDIQGSKSFSFLVS